MAAPTRRIVARAVVPRLGPIEDGLDATAHPASGFGLLGPDRPNAFEDARRVDRSDRQVAYNRIDVTCQRRRPLRRMRRVLPADRVGLDVGLGALPESDRSGGF